MNIRRAEEDQVRSMLGGNDGHLGVSAAFMRGLLDELATLRGDAPMPGPVGRLTIEDRFYQLECAISELCVALQC